jgi:probable addiction module antidote protein
MKAARPHDDAMVELLREDPAFADEYLAAALEEAEEPGGRQALLRALRHVAHAQGMQEVAARAGLRRESLSRALSPKGNPTLETLLAVLSAAGLRLAVARRENIRPDRVLPRLSRRGENREPFTRLVRHPKRRSAVKECRPKARRELFSRSLAVHLGTPTK